MKPNEPAESPDVLGTADGVPEVHPDVRKVVALSPGGEPLIGGEGGEPPVPCRRLASIDPRSLVVGAEVLVLFAGGDRARPVIAGVLAAQAAPHLRAVEAAPPPGMPDHAWVDGRRVAIRGEDEIVLVCGEASITLRRNGKVIVRGTQVESHALGTQRVTGAAVKIN